MRLQRMLARAGIASRRDAEELIRKGRVQVNGEIAVLGMSVDPSRDEVVVGGRRVLPAASVWIALHKPVGYIVTKKDERGRPTVFDLLPSIPGLTYVGRLDVNTSGLVLMTTDGDAANRLTHPRHRIERSYAAIVRGLGASDIRHAFSNRIVVSGRAVQIVSTKVRQLEKPDLCQLTLTLTEGRNRIVRRTCEAVGLRVEKLTRLRHGPIKLGDLGRGEWRYLTQIERDALSKDLSVQIDG